MKKLLALLVGVAFAMSSVGLAVAQDKKMEEKKTEEPKKDGEKKAEKKSSKKAPKKDATSTDKKMDEKKEEKKYTRRPRVTGEGTTPRRGWCPTGAGVREARRRPASAASPSRR